jgi:geranylgeranyl pyrophosphate synthase
LTKAYQILSSSSFKISDKKKTKLIEVMSKVSGEKGLLLGQYYDLSFKSPTLRRRLKLNKLKTARLMSFCCQAVAICANKNKNVEVRMQKIGEYIGEIFQINDDFADFPKMSKVNNEILLKYREKLAEKTIKNLNKIKLKKKKTFLLIDFLVDLKV